MKLWLRPMLALFSALTLTLPVFAHDEEGHHEEEHHEEAEEEKSASQPNYSPAFREGTLNFASPFAAKPDTLYLAFSHNYFLSSFPRGSNPAFMLNYTPLQNLQIETIASLRSPLELEGAIKYQLLNEYEDDLFSFAPRLAYNSRGHVLGLDLSANKFILPDLLQVGLGYRILSNAKEDGYDRIVQAVAANAIFRVWKHWHLFADLSLPIDGEILQKQGILWSAGIKKKIPSTPHILTLYAGNSQENTLLGRTISPGANLNSVFRVGFLFSIQIPQASQLPERMF